MKAAKLAVNEKPFNTVINSFQFGWRKTTNSTKDNEGYTTVNHRRGRGGRGGLRQQNQKSAPAHLYEQQSETAEDSEDQEVVLRTTDTSRSWDARMSDIDDWSTPAGPVEAWSSTDPTWDTQQVSAPLHTPPMAGPVQQQLNPQNNGQNSTAAVTAPAENHPAKNITAMPTPTYANETPQNAATVEGTTVPPQSGS